MKRNKDLIVFEIGGFNPKTGDFYLVEDGLHLLQLLVGRGIWEVRKGRRKRKGLEYLERLRRIQEEIIEHTLYSTDFVYLKIKFKPHFFKLLKELDRLNREAEK